MQVLQFEEVHEPTTTGGHYESDNAAPVEEDQEDLADDTSTMGNTGELSVPQPVHQLALILYNVLTEDPEYNAPVLEKLQIPPENPSESNLKLLTAAELSHMSSHLAITSNGLARRAQPDEFGDISGISD